jgi:methionyl-tRNA formyltransferase
VRVAFLGKPKSAPAMAWTREAADVVAVVGDGLGTDSVDDAVAARPDVVVSYLYPRRIRDPLLSCAPRGCLNFHPAPLPDFRGLGGINAAIAEGLSEWGVSAHYVDAGIDTGDLIRVDRFPFDSETATALSLDALAQRRLFDLYADVMTRLVWGGFADRTPQGPGGRYISRADFERMRVVRPGDDADRKARAFWYPPHAGAHAEGSEATIVPKCVLAHARVSPYFVAM